ncbi:MAG: non-heme iron oxygenase ferredoxin subunit [Burkholderiaceae bacterium]|nr:non-heme iron oxygenase ferredoxin subunit [Burkholderiaceae bacterium]
MNERWVRVADTKDIPTGGTLQVRLGVDPVCLYNIDGCIYATHDVCSHGKASLADGSIRGDEIVCALHKGRFHIPTGKAVGVPCTNDIRTYAVKVEDGAAWLNSE